MRPRVPWMNELDDTILEFLAAIGTPDGEEVVIAPKDVWLNVKVLRKKTDKASNTVSRRMANLESKGLLQLVGDSGKHYVITDKGRAYLAGDLDASKLED